MATSISLKELGVFRKLVQKADLETLLSSDVLCRAFDAVSSSHPDDLTLDLLSLHLTLYRQLRHVFESADSAQTIADQTHDRLDQALRPGQPCADLLFTCLESSVRTRSLRAAEALSALGRMVDVLPCPSASTSSSATSNPLVPLFQHAATAKDLGKTEMIVINALFPHVPATAIPDGLRSKLLADMDNLDGANLRSSILVHVLVRSAEVLKEEAIDAAILDPIMPLLVKDEPTTLLNLTRYLLPSLFSARPSTTRSLLDALSGYGNGEEAFSAWISVAALGVASGSIDTSDLPADDLRDAIAHADSSVQLRALQLLIGTKHLLRDDIMGLIKESIMANAVLSSAGARSEFVSTLYAFFKKAREMREVISKQNAIDPRLRVANEFDSWLLESFIDQGLLTACSYPVVQAILALNVLRIFLDVFGHQPAIQEQVFTHDRVSALLVCQASEFTEVRSRARAILERAIVPLPLLATASSASADALRRSALESLNHPRKTQAEAGKSVLCILFQRLAATSAQGEDRQFVVDLIDRLEAHVAASERSLTRGLEESPLHGILSAVSDVVRCIKLRDESTQRAWMPLFARLVELVDRVWAVTRPVISLAPSKTSDADQPDHEIARAYAVLGGEEEDEDEAMDHTNLLSGSWRATKEAGELLAALFRLPLVQLKADQVMWTDSQVNDAGRRFLVWMHEIRHRGTFSKIAVAFTDLVDAVKGVDVLKPLCHSWLQDELRIITTDSLSTTRRSAALPYSVLAIVANDVALLDQAFEVLNELARVDNTSSSDVTKVHAFNILKIVLLDARQSKLLDRYFERAVMTASHAFASPNWNVRNVGLILFSTIVHRSLAPGRGTQDYFASGSTLASRQTLWNWHSKYPSIIPYVKQVLESAEVTTPNAHSPLFPILIILRSLRWSAPGANLASQLETVVERFLASREWQIRGVAAQALSSLLSPAAGLQRLLAWSWDKAGGANQRHGELACLSFEVSGSIDWTDVDEDHRRQVEEVLLAIVRIAALEPSALVVKSVLELGTAYLAVSASSLVEQQLVELAQLSLKRTAELPGTSLLHSTASEAMLRYAGSAQSVSALIRSPIEEANLAAIARVAEASDLTNASALRDLVEVVITSRGLATRIAALEALSELSPGDNRDSIDDACLRRLELAVRAYSSSASVPLREAALAVSGLHMAWALQRDTATVDEERVRSLIASIDVASNIEQPQPSRRAALLAIKPLTPFIYPTDSERSPFSPSALASLHRLILRLLQDDSDDIRVTAGEIVRQGSGRKRAVCQSRAMELEWMFIGKATGRDGMSVWGGLLSDALLDKESFANDVRRTRKLSSSTEVLFEVEPPNLFRDPSVDLRLAAKVIRDLPADCAQVVEAIRGQMQEAEQVLCDFDQDEVSGGLIDGRYDARRRIERRVEIWHSVCQ